LGSLVGVATPRWLDDDEQRAWRGLVEVFGRVLAVLDAELQTEHGLSAGDYAVLVSLSEAPGERLRMCDLAQRLQLSPSGLTRRMDGLVRLGLVDREPSPCDRRVLLAALTSDGRAAVLRAAPDHVEGVRRHLLDHISREQLAVIAEAFDAVRDATVQPGSSARTASIESASAGSLSGR
jgi:DNA-binding MarR family transcriptional regulator